MTIRRILVPLEDEEFGTQVCKFIATSLWQPKTEFLVLHVIRQPVLPLALPSYAEYAELIVTAGWKFVERMSAIIKEAHPKAKVDEMVVEGDPKVKILEMAETWEPDLIVMGSHGRIGALKQLLLGSVSQAVSAYAPCPVLIVRPVRPRHGETGVSVESEAGVTA